MLTKFQLLLNQASENQPNKILCSNNCLLFLCILLNSCTYFSATHEKGFILYLTSSHLSFWLILRIYHILWPQLNNMLKKSYRQKLFLFTFSFVCLMLMGYFYYRHIVHCDNMGKVIYSFESYDSLVCALYKSL